VSAKFDANWISGSGDRRTSTSKHTFIFIYKRRTQEKNNNMPYKCLSKTNFNFNVYMHIDIIWVLARQSNIVNKNI